MLLKARNLVVAIEELVYFRASCAWLPKLLVPASCPLMGTAPPVEAGKKESVHLSFSLFLVSHNLFEVGVTVST